MPERYQNFCGQFVEFLRSPDRRPVIDLEKPESWYSGPISVSGGAGNPRGSKVRFSRKLKMRLKDILNLFNRELEQVEERNQYEKTFYKYCDKLILDVLESKEGVLFGFGRAQKIINIFMKYQSAYANYFCKYDSDLPIVKNIAEITNFLHAPVDRYTLKHLANFERFRYLSMSKDYHISWKRDLDRHRYHKIQLAIRELSACPENPHEHSLHYEMDKIWNEDALG